MNKRPLLSLAPEKLLFAIFAASGFSGLIYESIWSHYLKLFLGHAAYAQALVLAIFMGGMSLGAWLSGNLSRRIAKPLTAYAFAEGAIGLLAIGFHVQFVEGSSWFMESMLPSIGSDWVPIAKWLFASAQILPQSILLGMTFPLMTAGLLRAMPERSGESISALYFANSIGGALGVLASGFVLINTLGLPGTAIAAGSINLLVAAGVLLLARQLGNAGAIAEPSTASPTQSRFLLGMLLVSLGTGLTSFFYEIGWIRMLSLVLGSSTHAFELMLSVFIIGLALGSLTMRRRIEGLKSETTTLGWIQILMGLAAVATLPLYSATFDVMAGLMDRVPKSATGYLLFSLASQLIAAAIMFPAAFFAGMTLPLITQTLIKRGYGERTIGWVYGANTVGGIAGVTLAVLTVMPVAGLKSLIVSGATLDFAIGLILLLTAGVSLRSPQRAAVAGGLAALALISFFAPFDHYRMSSGVFRAKQTVFTPEQGNVLFHADGKTATIAVLEKNGGTLREIRTNGKTDAAVNYGAPSQYTLDEVTMVMCGSLPLLLKPDAKTVANIGMGSGLTTNAILSHPGVQRVDTLEIEAEIVNGAKRFAPRNTRVFADPRSQVIIEDAKTYLSNHRSQYDIIVSEPSNPWVSGVSSLFSREFHATVKRHLTHSGLLLQWIQLYEIDEALVISVLKSIDATFDDYALYASNFGDLLIVATPNGPLPHLPPAPPGAGLAEEMAKAGIQRMQDVSAKLVATKKIITPLIRSYPVQVNSDYYPVLDQGANKARFLGKNALSISTAALEAIPMAEILDPNITASRNAMGATFAIRSKHFGTNHPSTLATTLRDLLAGIPLAPETSPEDSAKALKMIAECDVPPGGDRVFAALQFGLLASSSLRPFELESMYSALSGRECFAGLTGAEREWGSLMRAVANRDGKAMRDSSIKLLEAGEDKTASRKKYLATTALLGAIASGQAEEGIRQWNSYLPALFKEPPPFFYRMIAADR